MHRFAQLRRQPLSPLIISLALGLTACGGGDSTVTPVASTPTPVPVTLTGTAAVGAPLVNSTVSARCTTGTAVTPAITSATGQWTLNLGSVAMLPCAVEITGGTVSGAANTQVLHSYAQAAGVVNVTPLTDMIVAMAAAAQPTSWFGALDATHPPAIGTRLAAAQTTVIQALGTAHYTVPATAGFNLFSTGFNAAMGDTYDGLLEAFAKGLAASGKTYPELLASVLAGGSSASINLPAAVVAPVVPPVTPPVSGVSGLPTVDSSKCTLTTESVSIPGVGLITGMGQCGASAVADWSNSALKVLGTSTPCSVSIVSGLFTLTGGTQTITATMNYTNEDSMGFKNGVLSSMRAYDFKTDYHSIDISFSNGGVDGVVGGFKPVGGNLTNLTCVKA